MTESWLEIMSDPWAAVGLFGQALFFSRWIVQWIASERKKVSHVPLPFWLISLTGGLMTLVYAFHRNEPLWVLGQLVGVANYLRNIALIRKQRKSNLIEP